jgi:hypothetical protein
MSRIRINGPPVQSFCTSEYKTIWMQKGHLATEDPRQIRKQRKQANPPNLVEETFVEELNNVEEGT